MWEGGGRLHESTYIVSPSRRPIPSDPLPACHPDQLNEHCPVSRRSIPDSQSSLIRFTKTVLCFVFLFHTLIKSFVFSVLLVHVYNKHRFVFSVFFVSYVLQKLFCVFCFHTFTKTVLCFLFVSYGYKNRFVLSVFSS